MENAYYAEQEAHKKRHVFFGIIGILLLVFLGVTGWWYARFEPQQVPPPATEREYSRDIPPLSEASMAKLPEGFPRWFVLGEVPVVLSGTKSFDATSNLTTYDVATRVGSHPRIAYDDYVDFLTNTDWVITSQYMGESGAGSITAGRTGNVPIISFTPAERATTVRVVYRVPMR